MLASDYRKSNASRIRHIVRVVAAILLCALIIRGLTHTPYDGPSINSADAALDTVKRGTITDASGDLVNVLYVTLPVRAQPSSTVPLYKLSNRNTQAVRALVKLGRSSHGLVQVLDGLSQGDRVIISDMSEYDDFDRIRFVD